MPTAACPGADLWREILHTAAAESWQEHLDACLECQETVGRLGAEDSTGREIASRLAALSRPWDREEALRRAIANLKDDVPPADTGPFGPAFDAPPDPELPSCLGPYELGEVIGRGAGGVVRKAFDPSLQRTVAVKLLAPRLAARPEARERFLREARAAGRIAHDNAVTVHAVEEIGGQPFLVMQYVPGGSLQDRLDRGGPLPPRELLRLGAQVADALAAAHAQGLIHRDVKPANILLEEGGARARLSDFGLAQAAGADGAGTVAGTPAYMAPEQARGEPLDPRADLFGLGCVLYTMAAGRAPYRAGSTPDVLRQVCEEEPPPLRKLNPAVPERLEAIVRKLMAKDPADRYATAAEAAEALRREAARLEQPPQRWRRVLGGIAALLLVALGLGEATGTTQFLQAAITALRLPTPDGTLVVEIDDPGVKVTIDGQEVVLTGAGVHEVRLRPGEYRLRMNKDGRPEKTDVVTIQKEGRVVVRVSLEPGQVAGEPRPDGPHGKLRVEVTDPTATVSVGNRWNFTRADAPREYHLTPGEHTVWIDRPGRRVETRVVRIEEGRVTMLRIGPEPEVPAAAPQAPRPAESPEAARPVREFLGHTGAVGGVAFSPDGKLAVSGGGDKPVRLWDVATGKELRRFALPKELPGVRLRAGEEFKFREVRSVGFTPDGKHVFAAGVFGAVVLWDVQAPDRVKLLPFSEGEGFFGAGGTVYQAAVSPDGKQLAAGGRDGMIYVWDLAKQELVRKVKGHTAAVRGVAFSPDGKRLLTGSDDQTVRLWDLKSGKVVQYSFDGAIGSVAFTPDGRRVLFGGEKLTLWDLPSETQVWHSQFADARVTRAAVTPDGRFAVAALSDGNLHVADLTTGRAVLSARAHAGPVADVAVSPDGRFALSAGGNPILPNPRPVTEADFALRLWELPRVPGEFLEPPQGIGVRPLPENPLTGAVTAVRDNQIELSLGRNDGIGPGDRLEVYRLAPTPLYCGRARVINASPERAVAELEGPLYEPPRVGDRVAKIPPKR